MLLLIFVDFIDACETLRKELLKYMKIVKKFKEELKLTNLEKEESVVRLNESNKKNEFLRNQISSQDEKMKSLEQELVESKAKIENLTRTKSAVDNRSVSISLKPKTEKVYIPPFKRNNKEKAYFARLDKGKNFDVDVEVSKPISKPTAREHKKFVFVPAYHICGVVGHKTSCIRTMYLNKKEKKRYKASSLHPLIKTTFPLTKMPNSPPKNDYSHIQNYSPFLSRMTKGKSVK